MILHTLPDIKNTALTIGNFDGVHCGHQEIFRQLKQTASAQALTPWVMLFEPQPKEYFLREEAPLRLSQLRDKVSLIKNHGIDHIICLNFKKFTENLPADFIHLIKNRLDLKHLIIGDDFRFGKQAQGDIALLQTLSQTLGFELNIAPKICENNVRISSSKIRDAMQKNDWARAQKLLGHAYCLSGHVIHGNKHGRMLGFPTINLAIRQRMAVHGVYAVKVHFNKTTCFQGVANIGRRPSFFVKGRELLEVYIFDFHQDCYGEVVSVEFIEKIRDEMHFASLDLLKGQIAEDVLVAKQILSS